MLHEKITIFIEFVSNNKIVLQQYDLYFQDLINLINNKPNLNIYVSAKYISINFIPHAAVFNFRNNNFFVSHMTSKHNSKLNLLPLCDETNYNKNQYINYQNLQNNFNYFIKNDNLNYSLVYKNDLKMLELQQKIIKNSNYLNNFFFKIPEWTIFNELLIKPHNKTLLNIAKLSGWFNTNELSPFFNLKNIIYTESWNNNLIKIQKLSITDQKIITFKLLQYYQIHNNLDEIIINDFNFLEFCKQNNFYNEIIL